LPGSRSLCLASREPGSFSREVNVVELLQTATRASNIPLPPVVCVQFVLRGGFEIKHNAWFGECRFLATRLDVEYRWVETGWSNPWNLYGMVHDASNQMWFEPTRLSHLDLMLPTGLNRLIEKYRPEDSPNTEGHMQLFLMVDPVEYSDD